MAVSLLASEASWFQGQTSSKKMQNPFSDVMELDRLSPHKKSSENRDDSDSDSLEPPFEIHGIPVEEENDSSSISVETESANNSIAQAQAQTQVEVDSHPLKNSAFESNVKGANLQLAFPPPVVIIPSEQSSSQEYPDNDQSIMPVSISTKPQAVVRQTVDIHDYHSSSSDDEAPHSVQFEQQQPKYSPERHPLIPQASNSSSPGRNSPYDLSRLNPLRLGRNF